ncbi:MAG: acyl-homoserine-lactone synthase [Sulfitobacter sp.]|nr:acyl-homoserine-lactone synthase [Sulfitobacter sp.]
MLRFLYADQLASYPTLARAMFRDRAAQFHDRLGWDVSVDAHGEERDAYDALNPLYVIWETPEGGHGGSMRFLPTTGSVMVNDHFGHLISGPITSPFIWECTRFCLARGAGAHVAAGLMLGGGALMSNFAVRHFVGVFDGPMVRIYGRIGAAPEVLGSEGRGRARIAVGLWSFDGATQSQVAARAGVTPELAQFWFDQAFGVPGQKGWAQSA